MTRASTPEDLRKDNRAARRGSIFEPNTRFIGRWTLEVTGFGGDNERRSSVTEWGAELVFSPGPFMERHPYKSSTSYCFRFLCPASAIVLSDRARQRKRLASSTCDTLPLFFPPTLHSPHCLSLRPSTIMPALRTRDTQSRSMSNLSQQKYIHSPFRKH